VRTLPDQKRPFLKRPARNLLGAIIATALFLPDTGYTLGLGEIEVSSALNQKLSADIELLSATPEDAEKIIIKLASRKEFTRAGLDRPYSLTDLRFKSEVINGVPHIIVTSGSPIREPYLNFLIEIDWPNGHLLREYTVLLDPPVFMTQSASTASAAADKGGAQSGVAPASSGFRPGSTGSTNVVPVVTPGMSASPRPASAAQAPVAQAPATQAAPASVQPTWIPAPVVQQQSSINQPAGSYKIKTGDTAWSLADAMRPDQSITVPQMMIAMLRSNPESFINENVNGLKRGYILRVPDYDQIVAINQDEAGALVREQAALWRQYQQSQAGGEPVSAMEMDAMGAAQDSSDSGVTTSEEDAYLEIVSAGSGVSTMSSKDPTEMTTQELRSELALSRERVETERVEKEALQQRVDVLEQNVSKMKGMLSIEDAELAEAQSLSMPGEDVMAEEPMADEPVMEDADAEMVDEDLTDMSAEAVLDEAEVLDEDTGLVEEGAIDESGEEALFTDEISEEEIDETQPEMPEQVADDMVTPQPQIVSRPPADPLTQLLNNPMMLAAAGGGLLLIAALIGLIIKRRKAAAESAAPAVSSGFDGLESLTDDIEDDMADVADDIEAGVEVESLAGDSEAAEGDFDSDSTMILDSADDTVITETTPEEAEEARDDVIAEADVYLAYGIYQQAEELLTQAIVDNPDRDDYRVKLAETHYASKNADGLAEVAGELKTNVGDDSATWKKVMAMGQDLCPDRPIFQGDMVGAPVVGSMAPAEPEMDFDLGVDSDEAAGAVPDLDLSLDDEPLELPEMANESDSDEIQDEEEFVTEPANELEFDITDAGAVEETDVAADEDEFSLDIDASELDIDIKDETEDVATADDEVQEVADVDIDFGLDDVEPEADEEEAVLDLTEEAASLDMDFDLGEGDATGEEPVEELAEEAAEAVPVAAVEDEEEFDLSSLDDVDEVSTKLDLARAYLDMGDHEGTKGILEEVLAEGNDEQKQEANELMAKLS